MLSTSERDAKQLFPQVVKFLASNDIVVKKLATWFVSQHSNEKDLVLLAINTLVKDCYDANPMTRGLALRTLTSLPDPSLLQYSIQPILDGFKDRSAYVRRNAITACLKVHHISPSVISEYGIVDQLYSMIRDQDPLVITNCLSVLDEILVKEGGVVINKTMTYYLLNRLSLFTELGLTTVMGFLSKYKPRSDEECLEIMNVVDGYLKHNNSAVVLLSLQYFLHLIQDMPHLKREVYTRARGQILHFIASSSSELIFTLLQFIEGIIVEEKELLQPHVAVFFCRYNEPLYVKMKKIDLLPQLITNETVTDVLEELSMYCTDVNHVLSEHTIRALGNIALLSEPLFDKCVSKLLQLLSHGIDYVTSNILCVLQEMNLKEQNRLNDLLEYLPKCIDIVTDDKGKCALLWLLGEYGEHLDDSPYILEDYIDGSLDEINVSIQCHLLTATMKLFFKRPAECQDMLGKLLESCSKSHDIDLRDRTAYFYLLLQKDVLKAKEIVCQM